MARGPSLAVGIPPQHNRAPPVSRNEIMTPFSCSHWWQGQRQGWVPKFFNYAFTKPPDHSWSMHFTKACIPPFKITSKQWDEKLHAIPLNVLSLSTLTEAVQQGQPSLYNHAPGLLYRKYEMSRNMWFVCCWIKDFRRNCSTQLVLIQQD